MDDFVSPQRPPNQAASCPVSSRPVELQPPLGCSCSRCAERARQSQGASVCPAALGLVPWSCAHRGAHLLLLMVLSPSYRLLAPGAALPSDLPAQQVLHAEMQPCVKSPPWKASALILVWSQRGKNVLWGPSCCSFHAVPSMG